MPSAVMPICTVPMKRTGSSISASAARAPRLPPSASSCTCARGARHERVLGDDEEGVRQHERQHTQDPERGHRAASGEWGSPAAAGASCIAGDDSR